MYVYCMKIFAFILSLLIIILVCCSFAFTSEYDKSKLDRYVKFINNCDTSAVDYTLGLFS